MRKVLISAMVAIGLVGFMASSAWATQTVHATSSLTFSPKTAHISRGEKVVWKNTASVRHSVTSNGGWSKNTVIHPGAKTSFTFHSAGTYRYHCRFHSGMTGKIVVA
jgi:plastocyanin